MDAGREMIDLILCDYSMPGMNGVEFVQQIREIKIHIPVILYTGIPLDDRFHKEHNEFTKILPKPFDGQRLKAEIQKILERATIPVPNFYRKYEGLLPHLNSCIDNLETVLSTLGLKDYARATPEKVVSVYGVGNAFHIFQAWKNLDDLRRKIAPEKFL